MKILKKNEVTGPVWKSDWRDEPKSEYGYPTIEAVPRYQPEQATDELPYQASAPMWPGYSQSDSPLAG